jgi:hypothetical protein
MVTATSKECTASFPDLDITLIANVPTPIPASAVERMSDIPGIEVVDTPDSSTPTTED